MYIHDLDPGQSVDQIMLIIISMTRLAQRHLSVLVSCNLKGFLCNPLEAYETSWKPLRPQWKPLSRFEASMIPRPRQQPPPWQAFLRPSGDSQTCKCNEINAVHIQIFINLM